MAIAKYIQKGETLDMINPTDNLVVEGEIVPIGSTRIGIIGTNTEAGKVGTVHMVGVFEMPKAASLEIGIGDAVYFNVDDGVVNKTNSDIPCGFAVADALADDTTVLVKIG